MNEKRYNVWDIDGTIFLEDHKEGSYHIGQVGNVDIDCLNDIANRLNTLNDENEQLKQQISDLRKENYGNIDGVAFYQEENASLGERISDLEELNRIYVDFLVSEGYELIDVMNGDVE